MDTDQNQKIWYINFTWTEGSLFSNDSGVYCMSVNIF